MLMKCLLPSQIDKFKEALKDKDIKLSDFLKEDLSHEQVVDKVKPFAGEHAEDVANLIESKLILKNKAIGLRNAFDKLAQTHKWSPEEIVKQKERLSDYRAKQQERIFNPKEHESYLSSLVEKELGFKAPQEVAKKVFDLTQAVSKAREIKDPDFGVSAEYDKAKDALDSYVESQKPKDIRDIVSHNMALIARNNFILGFSTPLKTTEGQITNSSLDMLTRRIALKKMFGLNPETKTEGFKKAQDRSAKTGRNVLQMESPDDAHFLGSSSRSKKDIPENLGKSEHIERPSWGKFVGGVKEGIGYLADKDISIGNKALGTLEKTAEGSQYIAIGLEHQIAFTKFYQKAWLDMGDLMSTKIAEQEKAKDIKGRADEIFRDAMKIEPETPQGRALRKACQFQAARVTSTNENFLSNFSLKMKDGLNHIVPMGDKKFFPLGNFLVSMAKIPSAVISNMVENAGVGIPFGVRDVIVGKSKIGSKDLETQLEGLTQYAQGIQKLTRIAGSMAVGALWVNSLNKKDLRSDPWGNHFFRLKTPFGDKWINTEYISFANAAAGGFMEMRLGHAKQPQNIAGEYVSGVAQSLKTLPGSDEVKNVIDNLASHHFIQSLMRGLGQSVTDRSIPQASRALFKHAETMPWFGPNTRPVDRLFFGAHGVESTQDVAEDKREQKQQAIERKREARNE